MPVAVAVDALDNALFCSLFERGNLTALVIRCGAALCLRHNVSSTRYVRSSSVCGWAGLAFAYPSEELNDQTGKRIILNKYAGSRSSPFSALPYANRTTSPTS